MCISTTTAGLLIAGASLGVGVASAVSSGSRKTPDLEIPAPEISSSAPPPKTTEEDRGKARSSIREAQRKRLALRGTRSTILTGGSGLNERATLSRKTLLGG